MRAVTDVLHVAMQSENRPKTATRDESLPASTLRQPRNMPTSDKKILRSIFCSLLEYLK